MIKKRIEMKIIYSGVIVLLCIGSYLLGRFVKAGDASSQTVVDFDNKTNDAFGPEFVNAVGLYYLINKETEHALNLKKYLDTLSYLRNNLDYFNVSDSNFLILYKPTNLRFRNNIYGFTKNEFLVFSSKKVILKNYPYEYVSRGSPE